MTTVAACECQCIEQPWHAMIEDGSIVAAGLVAERAGKPTLADAGQAHDILRKNRCLKSSFDIHIILAPVNASPSYDDSFMRVAPTL